jgi:hypothetical protein
MLNGTGISGQIMNIIIRYLNAMGEGHFVGLNMSMQPYNNSLWYLEGDEMVYVDGENFPSVYGTGTEDYFTSGWYFKNGTYNAPYHGVIILDDSLGKVAAYRFHVGDAIPFTNSLKFEMEHGHGNEVTADYSSTAYWYQKEPHKKFPEILKASLRIPLRVVIPNGLVEAEGIKPAGNITSYIEDMSDFGPDWSSLKQLHVKTDDKAIEFTMVLPGGVEKGYNIDIYYTTGPEYDDFYVFNGNKKIGEIKGYNDVVYPGGKLTLENVPTENQEVKLVFKTSGKNGNDPFFDAGIDGFKMEPVREFISEWYMIGPFPNRRNSDVERFGLDTPFPPEKEINLEESYEGAGGQEVNWKLEKTPKSGFMSLWQKYNPYEFVVAYALTYVYSPVDKNVPMYIGSDDGSKVFLNDKEVYRFLDVRISAPDQDKIILPLRKGWNKLLLKIENNFGGYGFYARIPDRDNNLIISTTKEK